MGPPLLPPDLRLGRVRLQVADLDRSIAYYLDVLGLRVLSRDGGEAALGAYGDDRSLVELRAAPGARPIPYRGRLGIYHYALLVPDRRSLGAFLAHLRHIGVRVGTADHLTSEALYLWDPDGVGIEVYADRPRSEWRYEGGQVVMENSALREEDLLREGRESAWRGMPAGTVMGHVHFYVPDLEAAARFYRDGLGLKVTVTTYQGVLFFGAGGYHHHVGVNTWAGEAPSPGAGDARLLDWELVVPRREAAEAAVRRLEGAGFPPEVVGSAWLATDPCGITVRLAVEGEA